VSDPLLDNAFGIDVSHWQSTTPSLAGLDFLFARASIGTQTDERYGQHIAAAKKAGLVTGAYHFGDNRTTADAQAAAFLKAAGDVDLYVLDHEGANQMTDAQAKRFIALVKAARGGCGLYASLSGFPSFGQSYNWIALWASTPPTKAWTFWQFGGSGIDHDIFNGTRADLLAFAGREEPMTEIDFAPAPATLDIPQGIAILNPDGSARIASNPGLRTSVFSPGTTRSAGDTVLRLVTWTRPDPDPDLLLAIYGSKATNVRALVSDGITQETVDDAVTTALEAYKAGEAQRTAEAKATAATAERELIASRAGAAESNRIRNL
jgi:hypothetical protein